MNTIDKVSEFGNRFKQYIATYEPQYIWLYDDLFVNRPIITKKILDKLQALYQGFIPNSTLITFLVELYDLNKSEQLLGVRLCLILIDQSKRMIPPNMALMDNELYVNKGIGFEDVDSLQEYKIHLMPRERQDERLLGDTELLEVFWRNLIKHIETDPLLYTNIAQYKVILLENLDGAPRIVLYTNNKKSAQLVLDRIYLYYKDWPATLIQPVPLFNKKVTDLIYFAQGSRDDKNRYFDENISHVIRSKCNDVNEHECLRLVQDEYKSRPIPLKYQLPDMTYYTKQYGEHIYGHQLPERPFDLKLHVHDNIKQHLSHSGTHQHQQERTSDYRHSH